MESRQPSRRRNVGGDNREVLPWHREPSIAAGMLNLPVSPVGNCLSRPTPSSSPLSSLGGAVSPQEDRRQFLSNVLEAALLLAEDYRLPRVDDQDGDDIGCCDGPAQDGRREPDQEPPKR